MSDNQSMHCSVLDKKIPAQNVQVNLSAYI